MEIEEEQIYEQLGFRKGFSWENRFMKQEEIKTPKGQKILVSTVDLGLDHNFAGTGEPLYYETCIFNLSEYDLGFLVDVVERYTTEEEAIKGHKKYVKKIKSFIKK